MKDGQTAWLVERRENGRTVGYLAQFGTMIGCASFGWTMEIEQALKFADKDSADRMAMTMHSETLVCDHLWCE